MTGGLVILTPCWRALACREILDPSPPFAPPGPLLPLQGPRRWEEPPSLLHDRSSTHWERGWRPVPALPGCPAGCCPALPAPACPRRAQISAKKKSQPHLKPLTRQPHLFSSSYFFLHRHVFNSPFLILEQLVLDTTSVKMGFADLLTDAGATSTCCFCCRPGGTA